MELLPQQSKIYSVFPIVVTQVTPWTEASLLCSLPRTKVLSWLSYLLVTLTITYYHDSGSICRKNNAQDISMLLHKAGKMLLQGTLRAEHHSVFLTCAVHYRHMLPWEQTEILIKYRVTKCCLLCSTSNTFAYFTPSITTVKCNNKQQKKCANEVLNA